MSEAKNLVFRSQNSIQQALILLSLAVQSITLTALPRNFYTNEKIEKKMILCNFLIGCKYYYQL
ncbi:MAG: hypothetical protein EAZ20_00775 [Bacteroidetes bacterium]|nr:MAG: hypothetical protein EAZ20_00775 [Bacteroidota bacterium]